MKLKTEQEIYELSMNKAHEIDPLSYGKVYDQAQQDLLASASEGFDEDYFSGHGCLTGDCPHGTSKKCLLEACQTAKPSSLREMGEIKARIENEAKVTAAWKESYIARTDEVLVLRGEVFKLRKENQEMRETLGKTRKELAAALNFLQSMGWQNYEMEEPEFQCQDSLSTTLFNLHEFNLSETPNSSKEGV